MLLDELPVIFFCFVAVHLVEPGSVIPLGWREVMFLTVHELKMVRGSVAKLTDPQVASPGPYFRSPVPRSPPMDHDYDWVLEVAGNKPTKPTPNENSVQGGLGHLNSYVFCTHNSNAQRGEQSVAP